MRAVVLGAAFMVAGLGAGALMKKNNFASSLTNSCMSIDQTLQGAKRQASCECAAEATVDSMGMSPFIPFFGNQGILRGSTNPGGLWSTKLYECMMYYK